MVDLTYDSEADAWVLPVPVADWLNNRLATARFTKLLADKGIAEEDFNAFLEHNWRYTQLQPDEIKARVDEFLAARDTPVVVEEPVPPAADEAPVVVNEQPVASVETAAEKPAATEKPKPPTRPKIAKQAKPKVKPCENCGLEPGAVTPVGWLCPTCARKKADAAAAQSQRKIS